MTLRWSNGHRTFVTLTDLNRATNAAYDRCESGSGHVASGESVERVFPGTVRQLPICANCGCPYGGPKVNWSSGGVRARGPKLPGPLPRARDGERWP